MTDRVAHAMRFDIAIVALVSVLAIALHVALFVLFRRWMDRDLALSLGGEDAAKRAYMLVKLEEARRTGVKRRDLPAWLQQAAVEYAGE